MSKFLTVLTILITWSCGLSNICDNEIVKEIYSPDKQLKAIIFKRDCGATTGTSSQLSILKADKQLTNEGGNAFVVDKGDITIDWTGPKQLQVYFDSLGHTFEMKDKIEGIEIKYKGL
jgi:hypothetical protein